MIFVCMMFVWCKAAWEAEQALRAAKEEEVKDKMLSLAGLIDHNSGRTHAIHFAVEKTEQVPPITITIMAIFLT